MFLPNGVPPGHRFDCIVVGSGPAGLTIAVTLAAANRRVLLFESGSDTDMRTDLMNTIGYGSFSRTYWNNHAIMAIGGTSTVWAGWCGTYPDIDFDNPAVGVSWPIGNRELRPFYRKTAEILERDPNFAEFQTPIFPGFIYRPFMTGNPTRFGRNYAELLQTSGNIWVAADATVVGFEATESRSAITALHYYHHPTRSRRELTIGEGQAVVLAGGGIGNARLLMQPRADGTVPVGNETGLVGRYLMEHPHIHRLAECVIDIEVEKHWPDAHDAGGANAIIADEALMRRHQLMGCSVHFFSKSTDHTLVRHLTAQHGRQFYHYDLGVRSEMLPREGNEVAITAERHESGLHRVTARCVYGAEDLYNIEKTLRVLGETLIATSHGRVRITNDMIYKYAIGGGHIMGTTRMGTTPARSVVDRHCRVHGYDNFYVAGSSVFPTGGYVNPTFTIVAVSLRLADHLIQRSGRS